MDRWKALGLSSFFFTLGVAYATACGTGSPTDTAFAGKGSSYETPSSSAPTSTPTSTPTDSSLAARVAELEAELERWACFRDHMTDDWRWHRGSRGEYWTTWQDPFGTPWEAAQATKAHEHCWEGGSAPGDTTIEDLPPETDTDTDTDADVDTDTDTDSDIDGGTGTDTAAL